MELQSNLFALLLVSFAFCHAPAFLQAKLLREEVDVLEQMAATLGYKNWVFNAEYCSIGDAGLPTISPANKTVKCVPNGDDFSVQSISIKNCNLSGVLPPQIAQLPLLTEIDFFGNYLNGSIPREWFSTNLTSISVSVNRLSGEIPKGLGKMTSLSSINLEANHFSGSVPPELGNLLNLHTLILSSNMLSGSLPNTLGELAEMKDFRISDNNFVGVIPSFIQNWKNLTRLEIHGSGLEGPIPGNISLLNNLVTLRISDISGPDQPFPDLRNANSITTLVLRSCNIAGEIPYYIWHMDSIEMLDLSFNKLVGTIPLDLTLKARRFLFLTGNMLSGSIPDPLLRDGSSVDLSYNNFTFQDSHDLSCDINLNLKVNVYRSSSHLNSSLRPTTSCLSSDICSRYSRCLRVDCGGSGPEAEKEFDGNVPGGDALYYRDKENEWGLSSTGDYMDDNDFKNVVYVDHLESQSLPKLYQTARRAPISLTYFHRCLENGIYNVTLYFAELKFTHDETYASLGRRVFDIYVQDKLVRKNFNILDEVRFPETQCLVSENGVNVTQNYLEVRLYFAGKGTTRIPVRGVYGPIISGVSFISASKGCDADRKTGYIVGGVIGAFCGFLVIVGIIICGVICAKRKKRGALTGRDSEVPAGTFSLKQIKEATNDFDSSNKIGEGGFGPVYKGTLADGTVVAVKQLSAKSNQGNREFVNEIAMISCLRHPNLVKLHGFCVEGKQLLLVYEYMENNSLHRALFGKDGEKLDLDWATRQKICVGIAKGLAFLHEESTLKIVHRDIKATNVLLDKQLNPKISDFGLARLREEDKSHISTRIAGTIGYMAPEYALYGYLTDKVDVYSFGVVALELVSGRTNNDSTLSQNCFCLMDKAACLLQSGRLGDIVDKGLKGNVVEAEALVMAKVAVLCAHASPTLRPNMSDVVGMLEGRVGVPDVAPSFRGDDARFRALRELGNAPDNDQRTTCSLTDGSAMSPTSSVSENRSLLTIKSQITTHD